MARSTASRKRAIRSGGWPQSASPFFQVAAVLLGELLGSHALARGIGRNPPTARNPTARAAGTPAAGCRDRPWVDADGRDAVDGGFLQQRQAQAGLAAAGHADADGVGRQVLRVVEHQVVAERCRRRARFRGRGRRRRAFRSPAWRCTSLDGSPGTALIVGQTRPCLDVCAKLRRYSPLTCRDKS